MVSFTKCGGFISHLTYRLCKVCSSCDCNRWLESINFTKVVNTPVLFAYILIVPNN